MFLYVVQVKNDGNKAHAAAGGFSAKRREAHFCCPCHERRQKEKSVLLVCCRFCAVDFVEMELRCRHTFLWPLECKAEATTVKI